MKEKIEQLRNLSIEELAHIASIEELNAFTVKYLGKSGELTAILRGMKDVAPADRPVIGGYVNQLRNELEESIAKLKIELEEKAINEKVAKEKIDITEPSKGNVQGALHPLEKTFNKVIDIIVIISMSLPIIGADSAMISLMHQLNIYDTFPGLYMQKFYFGNMYYLMFSAIFKGVSKEYYEAAYIDGATEWQVMVKVAIPLVLTSFGLVFLLHFITFWNDYHTLLVYAPSHPTITYGLFKVMTEPSGSSVRGQTTVQMAGCTLITLPVVILFIIFRNKLMGNLTIGGVKE